MSLTKASFACAPFIFFGALSACSASTDGSSSATSTEAVSQDAKTVVTHANGTISPWKTLAPLPVPRANHCSIAINGWLLVIGGNFSTPNGFVSTSDIHAAETHPDGSLGPWKLVGATPSAVSECTVAANGSTLLLVDGIFDTDSDGGQVWSANFSKVGELAAWSSLGALPGTTRLLATDAWVDGNMLFAMESKLPDDGDVNVLHRTPLGGALAWAESDWLPSFRGHAQFAHDPSFVYAVGGYDAANDMLATVMRGSRKSGGTVVSPTTSRVLPVATGFGTATVVDDYMFLVGGKSAIFSASGTANTYSSALGKEGALGTWTAGAALPQGRTDHAIALAGDYLYLTGGGFAAGGLNTVFAARVRFPAK